MTDTFNYSFVKNEEGNFSLRSTVKSFNLDHVTDKDIVSFYHSFSSYASFDTGLLPLNGTGVLAIRTAGPHAQIVTQHAPGLYHINWGAHEGDKHAKAYYVAQPYRIVIGDFENGNLLGARMFYSPYPITNPAQQLYHVNLPNINCRGYRGNGVGWICLYLREDWSSLPFNEKVSRFIERCSGVETYNDANMSETDGPRFYERNSKPSYLSSPVLWQEKSEQEGFEWTLDPDLWIPIKVKGIDDQGSHDPNGEPLTLAMAMLGNYQAYYTDTNIPKMYNVISRSDLSLSNTNIAEFIKKSFATAPAIHQHSKKDNPYSFTVEHREENGSAVLNIPNLFSQDEDEDQVTCDDCSSIYHINSMTLTSYDYHVCEDCLSNNYTFIEHLEAWYSYNDDSVTWSEIDQIHYHEDYDTITHCSDCTEYFGTIGNTPQSIKKQKARVYLNQNSEEICSDCLDATISPDPFGEEPNLSFTHCYSCAKKVIDDIGWSAVYPTFSALIYDTTTENMVPGKATFCHDCAKDNYVCPCGLIKPSTETLLQCTPTTFDIDDKTVTVSSCCQTCFGNATEENGQIVIKYQPFNKELTDLSHNISDNFILHNVMGAVIELKDSEF